MGSNTTHTGRQAVSFWLACRPDSFSERRQMKLHEDQLNLIRHAIRFPVTNYLDCLEILGGTAGGDRLKLSYAFRPLTKNGYLAKRKDGSVTVLAKGRALFSEEKPLISAGGGAAERQRLMAVSRIAALMERNGVPAVAEGPEAPQPQFIPSACWRKIAPGILSTTRFVGMLTAYGRQLAVYDIGDGTMEWQSRAEGSLFYTKYGTYETKATGMLLICREDIRDKVAENIIRQTMWHRRQLLSSGCAERNKPAHWSRSPIRLRTQYEHVYLTTPERLNKSLQTIWAEESYIEEFLEDGTRINDPTQGDIERWPYRYFVNPACDLLKYVYFFSAAKELLKLLEDSSVHTPLRYAICYDEGDVGILRMYPDVIEIEGMQFYEYRSEEDADAD